MTNALKGPCTSTLVTGALLVFAMCALLLFAPTPALAYNENNYVANIGEFAQRVPHGAYKTTTSRCPMQNFPHETENANMLVETYDDLCLNCHPMAQLP